MSLHQVDKFPFLTEHSGPGGMYIQITCSRCGTTDDRRQKYKEMSIGDVHIPYWRHKGWTFKKNEAICLRCRDEEHRKKKQEPLKTTIGDAIAAKLTLVPEPMKPVPTPKPFEPPVVVEPLPEPLPEPKPEIVSSLPKEPHIKQKFELRPNLQFTAEREAYDNEVFEVLEKNGGWMTSAEIQELVGGGLQQVRNAIHRLQELNVAEIKGETRHTRYKIKHKVKHKVKPPPKTPPAPTPKPQEEPKRSMKYHPPEFKRYVVETAHDLGRKERDDFYKSLNLNIGTVPYFKREYIEGRLGTLEKPIRIVPLKIKLEPLRTRKFSDNYKKRVIEEVANVKDVDEYLRVRGLSKKTVERWQQDTPATIENNIMDTRLQFKLYDMLREHCPDGRYKTGWSDDCVARELHINQSVVERIRKEVYPTIDPALVELRRDLEALKKKFDEDMKGLRELEKSIRDDFQRQYDGLSDRLSAVETR